MTPKRAIAIFFACPILIAVAGFVLGLMLPTPAARFQFHQAQGFLFTGFVLGLIGACAWIGVSFVLQVSRRGDKQ